MKKSLLLCNIYCSFLFCALSLFSIKSNATISGGTISLKPSTLLTSQNTCVGSCNGSNCIYEGYNYISPSGGSGSFIYIWEKKVNNGSWIPMPFPGSGISSGFNLPYPSSLGEYVYYRRKAKDSNNLSDSAYSNVLEITTWNISHGSINFYPNSSSMEFVPVGGTPPRIDQSCYSNEPYTYRGVEEKVGVNGTWNEVSFVLYNFPTYTSYNPPTRTTPGEVYYRFWLENICHDVPGYTNEIKLVFFTPIAYNPGTISSDTNNVCAGTPIRLKATPTNAPSPFSYMWQTSADSINWAYAASTDSFTDNNFTATRYYRRIVNTSNYTYYSNVIKVSVYSPGNPAVFGFKEWNIYCYNGKNINTTGVYYRGYYKSAPLNINTLSNWADSLSPSAATGYVGCPVNNNNFTISAKRINFDSGVYQMQVPLNNDAVAIKVNGSNVYSATCCNINPANINIGKLGPTTKVEVTQITGTAYAALQVNFIKVDSSTTVSYTDSSCQTYDVRNPALSQFVPLVDSSGKVVAAVYPNYVYMGNVAVAMKHSAPGAANMPMGNFGVLNMPRYFNFSASNYINTPFPNPVTVRLYYLNSEFDDYKIATNQPSLTINDLRVAHYDGVNQDCSVSNNGSAGDTLVPIGSGTFGANAFYIDVLATRFSEFGVNGSLSTLPVKWLSANATARKNEVLLQWRVANEMNNNGFEIQRSNDGFSYTTIGKVASKGNSENAVAYSFTDKTMVENSTLYYRIKQVDKDNHFSLSPVMKVKLENIRQIVLQPNPVNNTAMLRANSIISHISITDVSGRRLYNANHSSNEVIVDVSTFSRGVYVIKALLATGEERVLKMVKE